MPRKHTESEIDPINKKFRNIFTTIPKPELEARLPKQLSTLTSEKLSDLMNVYAAWRELTEDLMVEALTDYVRKKEMYEFEYSKELLCTNGSTVKEKEAKVSTNLRIREIHLTLQDAETYHTLLSAKLESYTNCLTVISREITRRTNRDA